LTARPQFAYDCPRITVYTLRFAILRGDIDTFHYLMERAVHEHDRLRQEPWTLLEAAAFHKDPSTFSAVVKYGLDVTQINESGSGSALAAASASNQLELVRRLYHLGVDISTIAVGFDNDDLVFKNSPNLESLLVDSNPDWFGSERRCRLDLSLASINGMAALHAAVKNQNREIVEFLISNGANVNQCYYPPGYQYSCSPVFPLQVATYYGNETLVSMLLDAGADPNSVAGDVMKVSKDRSADSLIREQKEYYCYIRKKCRLAAYLTVLLARLCDRATPDPFPGACSKVIYQSELVLY